MDLTGTQIGKMGEELAWKFLKKAGYRLLERNYRSGHQEIDLICRDGDYIVFVEVKARSSTRFGTPAASITGRKQAFLRKAALAYLTEQSLTEQPARFDAVEVFLPEGIVRHIPNAF